MNIKKTLLCLLLILSLCLCLVLASCKKDPVDEPPVEPPVTDDGNSKKGEITKTEDANNTANIPQPNEGVGEGETNRYD